MDFCKTQAGQRLLRAAILQPPLSKKIIESRLDCVQELMDSPEIMNGLQVRIYHSLYKQSHHGSFLQLPFKI